MVRAGLTGRPDLNRGFSFLHKPRTSARLVDPMAVRSTFL
jgi:hypothetical protein